ncbi:hypothetical protein Pfo_019110 [Paulownia fortunei]|nr:hypothetical protein Pfo_019110 [Paulownia fortunei]
MAFYPGKSVREEGDQWNSIDYLLTIVNDCSSSMEDEPFPWNMEYFNDFLWLIVDLYSKSRLAKLSNTVQRLEDSAKGVRVASRELDGSENLRREIKAVANQAGCALYSFLFRTDFGTKRNRIYAALYLLLRNIDLVKAKIREHCIRKASSLVTLSSTEVVSPYVLHFLIEDLEELMNSRADLIVDIKDDVKKLHEELVSWRSFLVHIQAGQQGRPVRQIGDAILGAGHVITSLMLGDGPIWYVALRLSDAINRIKLIRMEHVEIEKSFGIGVVKNPSQQMSFQAKENSVVNDIFVGFEDEKTQILYQLIGRKPQHLQIISIFGMPGLGKTTLAKNLYNHPSVTCHFDKCAWGVVSQTYQRRNLLINILSSLSKPDRNTILNMEDESLARQIYQTLKRRRYLIVMDDIWDSTAWDDLRRYFPDDKKWKQSTVYQSE